LSLITNKALIQHLRKQVAYRFPQAFAKWDEYIPLPTGICFLDHGLLKGGLPKGHLIEIVGSKSSGKTTLLFKMLSGFNKQESMIAYFDFSETFYPPSAQRSGVDLKKLLVLRPPNIPAGLRAAEILFRSGSICVAVFDLVATKDQIPKALLLRLKRSVRQARGIGIFLRGPSSTKIQGNQLALCLKVKRLNQEFWVETEKSLFGEESQSVELILNE
jgi:energy-coupling factor transporter ATP-binding protein EcfA2